MIGSSGGSFRKIINNFLYDRIKDTASALKDGKDLPKGNNIKNIGKRATSLRSFMGISNIIKESLKTDSLHEKVKENSLSVPLKEAREKFEKEYLTIQLKKFNGNISKTANFVGMERSALHRKLKGLGIKEFN